MKKQMSLLLLAAAPLALASCGGTSGVIPAGGSSVENATATPKLQAAVENVGSDGAFGVKLSNFNLKATADLNIPSAVLSLFGSGFANTMVVGNSSMPEIISAKGSASVSNVSFAAGVTGLEETDLNNVKASAKASADVAVDFHYVDTSVTYSQANIAAAAYLANQNLYLDSSSAGLASAVKEIQSFVSSFNIPLGKYLLKSNVFSLTAGPLLNADAKAQLKSIASDVYTNITTYSDYLKSYSYSDGRYFVGFDFSKADLVKFYNGVSAQMNSAMASYVPSSTTSTAGLIINLLNVSSFKAGVVFTEKAFKGFAYDFDISLDTTLAKIASQINPDLGSAIPSSYASLSEKGSFKASANFDFLNGSEVKVDLPSSFDGYTSVPSTSSSASSK